MVTTEEKQKTEQKNYQGNYKKQVRKLDLKQLNIEAKTKNKTDKERRGENNRSRNCKLQVSDIKKST